jgi:ABC-type Fe3+-hydroxamate transport system substrate-binding protein
MNAALVADGRTVETPSQHLTDWIGTRHAPAPDARILSLVPSLTETLFDLGLGENVVGRTAFCVHPADRVKQVRSVGGTKQVNWRKLDAAAPSHAVLNIDETPKELADELARRGIVPVVTHPIAPADNGPLIRLLGAVFDRDAAAEDLARRFETGLDALTAERPDRELRVLYLIWKAPWMTVGRETYISRFLDLIGWRTWSGDGDGNGDAEARYPEIEMTDALLANVDRVLFSSEPFPFNDAHLAEFRSAHPHHADKAMTVDGEMLSWYGARAVKGLAYLRSLSRGCSDAPQ